MSSTSFVLIAATLVVTMACCGDDESASQPGGGLTGTGASAGGTAGGPSGGGPNGGAPPHTEMLEFQPQLPDAVFVEGFAEREEMGIFFLDPERLTYPGDLWWKEGGRLQLREDLGGGDYAAGHEIALEVVSGTLPGGVVFDPVTGELSYDGTLLPASDESSVAEVRFSSVVDGVTKPSDPFRIRVLRPDVVWGEGATSRELPATWSSVPKYDDYREATGLGTAFTTAAEDALSGPDAVVFVLGGTYSFYDEEAATGALLYAVGSTVDHGIENLFLLGEPGDRPLFTYDITTPKATIDFRWPRTDPVEGQRKIQYAKNFSTLGTVDVDGTTSRFGARLQYWTKIHFGPANQANVDGIGSDGADGFTAEMSPLNPELVYTLTDPSDANLAPTNGEDGTRGGVAAPYSWQTRYVDFMWNAEFEQYLSNGGFKHNIYLHGRPYGYLFTNNCFHHGGQPSSMVKTTRTFVQHRNSRLWQYETLDVDAIEDTSDSGRVNRFYDQPSASETILFNCHMTAVYDRMFHMVWFNQRASHFGNNIWPPFPDITFQQAPFEPFALRHFKSGVSADQGTGHHAIIKGDQETAWRETCASTAWHDRIASLLAARADSGTGNARVRIYDGEQQGLGTTWAAKDNALLAEISLSGKPAFAAASGGTSALLGPASGAATATGTAVSFDLVNSEGEIAYWGAVGISGADITLSTTSLTAGQPVTITALDVVGRSAMWQGGSSWTWHSWICPDDIPESGVYRLHMRSSDDETKPNDRDVLLPSDDPQEVTLIAHKDAAWLLVSSSFPQQEDIPGTPSIRNGYLDKWTPDSGYFAEARGTNDSFLGDPQNPYTWKHYISHCVFEQAFRAEKPDARSGRAIDDQGCYPVAEMGSSETRKTRGPVPEGWHHLSVNYLMNNKFIGWLESDVDFSDPENPFWISKDPLDGAMYLYTDRTVPPTEDLEFFGVTEDGRVLLEQLEVSNQTPLAPDANVAQLPPAWFKL